MKEKGIGKRGEVGWARRGWYRLTKASTTRRCGFPAHATHPPKPLLEERWHAKRDGEVCRRAAAAARQRPLHTPRPYGKSSVR